MSARKIVWGVVFLSAAAAVLLDAASVIEIGAFRIIVTALMSGIFLKSLFSLNFIGIFMPAAVVCVLFAKELGIERFSPFPILLCGLFVTVGLCIIFGFDPLEKKSVSKCHETVPEDDGDSHIVITGTATSTVKYLSSENLENVTVNVKASNVVLYFDKAKLKENEAQIDISIQGSNLRMYVPSYWTVVDRMDDKSMSNVRFSNASHLGDAEIKLVLTGKAKMANVEVIYI